VEFAMTRSDAALKADTALLLEILRAAAVGVFPGPILERLIDRSEGRR
jgi:hypothetical protein